MLLVTLCLQTVVCVYVLARRMLIHVWPSHKKDRQWRQIAHVSMFMEMTKNRPNYVILLLSGDWKHVIINKSIIRLQYVDISLYHIQAPGKWQVLLKTFSVYMVPRVFLLSYLHKGTHLEVGLLLSHVKMCNCSAICEDVIVSLGICDIVLTSKEPVCPRVELILKIIIILLIIFLGFIKSKPC